MSIANWVSYGVGQCTRFVAQAYSWIPPFLGDAGHWLSSAPGYGIRTTNVAAPGEVAVLGADKIGGVGHVGIVKTVNSDGSVVLNDQNWDLHGTVMTHTIPANLVSGYLIPPNATAPNAVVAGTGPIAIPDPLAALGIRGFFSSVNIAPNEFLIRAGFITLGIILVTVGLIVAFKQEGRIAEIAATAAMA